MSERFQWLYQTKIMANSGPVYLLNQKATDQRYFGYENEKNKDHQNVFSIENKIQQELIAEKHFRSYQELIVTNDYNYYLFSYVEGNTIGELIHELKMQKKRMPFEQIKDYVYQLVKSLYFLHKQGILGRVFSVDNMIDNNGQLYLMDFGYHSDLQNTNSAILASPEAILELSYDNKIDIWLLGVFIFNLMRLQPITKLRYSQIEQYKMNLKQFEPFIKCNSSYYSQSLTNLVEKMLTVRKVDRITFAQLLKDQFFNEIQDKETMITFYEQIQMTEEKFQSYIRIRDFPSTIQDTKQLFFSDKTCRQQSFVDIHLLLTYFYPDFHNNFCQIWTYIYFEEYKIYLLESTVNFLDKILACLERIQGIYCFKKMQLLHVIQLLRYLETQQNQWNVELWNQFKQQSQFSDLKKSLIFLKEQIINQLKNLYPKLINNSEILQLMVNDCKNDELQNFEFNIKVESYQEIFVQMMHNIRRKINIQMRQQNQSQSSCLKLYYKCLICQLIPKLRLNNIEKHFPELQKCNLENLYQFIEFSGSLIYEESIRYLFRLYSGDGIDYD